MFTLINVSLLFVVGLSFMLWSQSQGDDPVADEDTPDPSEPDVEIDPNQLIALMSGDSVNAGAGEDTFSGGGTGIEARGGDGDDVFDVVGTDAASTDTTPSLFAGGDGNDMLTVTGGKAIARGGAGDDVLMGSEATLNGGEGNDTLSGTDSDLSGGAGDDLLSTTSVYYNTLSGGIGDDTINAAGPVFIVEGGAGDDVLNLDSDPGAEGSTADAGAGDDTINAAIDDLGTPDTFGVANSVTGGEGEDTYNLTIKTPNQGDYDPDTYTSGIVDLRTVFDVADFIPGTDFMSVTFTENTFSDLQLKSVVSSDTSAEDAELAFTFDRATPVAGEINEVRFNVQLRGGAGLGSEDFTVTTP